MNEAYSGDLPTPIGVNEDRVLRDTVVSVPQDTAGAVYRLNSTL